MTIEKWEKAVQSLKRSGYNVRWSPVWKAWIILKRLPVYADDNS
jgi:hypothetical protein